MAEKKPRTTVEVAPVVVTGGQMSHSVIHQTPVAATVPVKVDADFDTDDDVLEDLNVAVEVAPVSDVAMASDVASVSEVAMASEVASTSDVAPASEVAPASDVANTEEAASVADTEGATDSAEDVAKGSSVEGVASKQTVSGWLRAASRGHEGAIAGGIAGLLVVISVYAIGFWTTLLIVLFVVAGVAVGQIFDGDPRIIRVVRTFIEERSS